MKKHIKQCLIPLLFFGCIGTDVIDSEMVNESIVVAPDSGSLIIGDNLQLTGVYHNMFAIQEEVELTWIVADDNIVTIDAQGLVMAINSGQTIVNAIFGNTMSNDVLITVVQNTNDIASVAITPPSSSNLLPGETLQLSANTFNVNDEELEGKEITWASSNAGVASIDNTGLLTAIIDGSAQITATSEGVQSQPITIEIGNASVSKTGTFSGASGYTAEGTATLKEDNGVITLDLSADFRTSFALGTFIYLSNSTSGSGTRSGGLELGEITSNGAKSFDVTSKNAATALDTYQYVIVLCKPASITFGSAELK